MYKAIRNALIIIGVLLFIRCNRQIDCPDFDNSIMDWMPYQSGDTIALVNSATDTPLVLVIHELIINHTTHYMNNLDCGTCDDHILINGNESNTDFQIEIALNENRIISQHYNIGGDIFTEYYSDYSEMINYSFGGLTFDLVRIFEKQTPTDRFQKLIIAKEFGIVGLIEFGGNTWILKGMKTKHRIESVNIVKIACSS